MFAFFRIRVIEAARSGFRKLTSPHADISEVEKRSDTNSFILLAVETYNHLAIRFLFTVVSRLVSTGPANWVFIVSGFVRYVKCYIFKQNKVLRSISRIFWSEIRAHVDSCAASG